MFHIPKLGEHWNYPYTHWNSETIFMHIGKPNFEESQVFQLKLACRNCKLIFVIIMPQLIRFKKETICHQTQYNMYRKLIRQNFRHLKLIFKNKICSLLNPCMHLYCDWLSQPHFMPLARKEVSNDTTECKSSSWTKENSNYKTSYSLTQNFLRIGEFKKPRIKKQT